LKFVTTSHYQPTTDSSIGTIGGRRKQIRHFFDFFGIRRRIHENLAPVTGRWHHYNMSYMSIFGTRRCGALAATLALLLWGCQRSPEDLPVRSDVIGALLTATQEKITASDAAALDEFGYAVALDGDTAVVGAYRDNSNKYYDSGAAYVFVRSGTAWKQQAKLVAHGRGPSYYFGRAVAISGNTVVVGEPRRALSPSPPQGKGMIWIFVRSGTTWTHQTHIKAYDAAFNDEFGTAVAIHKDTVAVGAHNAKGGGAVYVLGRNGTAWGFHQKLQISTTGKLGCAVALDGDTLVAGARWDGGPFLRTGAAFVFTRPALSTKWFQQAKLTATSGASGEQLGRAVDISGDTVVVGVDQYPQKATGAMYVFARKGTAWSQQAKLVGSDTAYYDRFGYSVGVYKDLAVAGAVTDDDRGGDSGAAFVFTRSGTTWTQQAKLLAADGAAGDWLGGSMAVGDYTLVTGAHGDDDKGSSSGSAYVFKLNKGCTSNSQCVSGYCVDGVCCDTACGGGSTTDCMACSVSAGGSADGKCGPVKAGATCRAAGGGCGLVEVCDGKATSCPLDVHKVPGTLCRAMADICDVAEVCSGTSAACPTDTFQPSNTICRQEAGDCDALEKCTGKSAACPKDALRPATFVCRAAAGGCDLAEKCSGASAACPADVLAAANTVCRAAAGGCDLAEVCTGTGAACPGNLFKASTTVCRAAVGLCDLAESCTGTSAGCPADQLKPFGISCRAAAGDCDLAESCNGTSTLCPKDALRSSGVMCRAAADICDVAEACDGKTTACPANAYNASTTECRAAAGACDLAESCSGTSSACPADGFKPATAMCRPLAGDCDLVETCTGTAAACPKDLFKAGVTCRAAAGDCDVAETCSGTGASCPTDGFTPSGIQCRASVGDCDLAETCSGTGASCPADAYKTSSQVCRPASGPCDLHEKCNGLMPGCPVDLFRPATQVCRPATGTCDKSEQCTGASGSCPNDAYRAAGTVCRTTAGDCDLSEACDGLTASCPADVFKLTGTTCRAAAGDCDEGEVCSGISSACPADVYKSSGTLCRASLSECDLAEACSGLVTTCPNNAFKLNGTSCNNGAGSCLAGFCKPNTDAGQPDGLVDAGPEAGADGGPEAGVDQGPGDAPVADLKTDTTHQEKDASKPDTTDLPATDTGEQDTGKPDTAPDKTHVEVDSTKLDKGSSDSGFIGDSRQRTPPVTEEGCSCEVGAQRFGPGWLLIGLVGLWWRRRRKE